MFIQVGSKEFHKNTSLNFPCFKEHNTEDDCNSEVREKENQQRQCFLNSIQKEFYNTTVRALLTDHNMFAKDFYTLYILYTTSISGKLWLTKINLCDPCYFKVVWPYSSYLM